MEKKSPAEEVLHNYFTAIFNIFIFLPYFFSVPTLLRTLFKPWKNLTAESPHKNLSLSDSMNQMSFNLVSRGMGLVMRISLLLFFMVIQALVILIIPIITVFFLVSLPILIWKKSLEPSEESQKEAIHKGFMQNHVLKPENVPEAQKWFDSWYENHVQKNNWWELKSLFAYPPLARDWVAGYTPTLDIYTEELTTTVYQSDRIHFIGREKELNLLERDLSKSENANIILSADEGIGKHAIVDALAKKIYEGQVTVLLMYKRVLKLNLEKILTQEIDAKKREELLNELLKEAEEAKNIILVIDHIDRYLSSGVGRVDMAASIEKYARSASLHVIGLTTPFAYETYLSHNPLIQRLFSKVDVYELSKGEAYKILFEAAILFEFRYKVIIPYETVSETIEKCDHFITAIPFPEKAIQLLDEACIFTDEQKQHVVLPEYIDKVLSDKTHIPVAMTGDMKSKLLKLEELLRKAIVEQEEAVEQVATGLRRAFLLMGKRSKPLASFLFLGPTGVGKTQTAKVISQIVFDVETPLLRFDMSLYQTKDDIPKLIGSQESNTPGQLTATLQEHPYGVLLLDELEKADKNLLNIFLTILDEGYFTDGYGKRIDCKNLVIIATSNAGADLMYSMLKTKPDLQFSQEAVIDFLIKNQTYSPEFLNRFDAIVVYKPLTKSSSAIIARTMLTEVLEQIYSLYKVKVEVSDKTLQDIVSQNYNAAFGARTLERALRSHLEDTIAKLILSEQAHEGDTIKL